MDKLMTLREVADYLRLSNDTVYRMANTGTISASKVGNQWRFRREDIDAWLEANKNVGGRLAKRKQRHRK
jgi:excisionase family DNA binding protein